MMNVLILEVFKCVDVVLVNNKVFILNFNDWLVLFFFDFKFGCKVVFFKFFVSVNVELDNSYNFNDVGLLIFYNEEYFYFEGFVSWMNVGGLYYIVIRRVVLS